MSIPVSTIQKVEVYKISNGTTYDTREEAEYQAARSRVFDPRRDMVRDNDDLARRQGRERLATPATNQRRWLERSACSCEHSPDHFVVRLVVEAFDATPQSVGGQPSRIGLKQEISSDSRCDGRYGKDSPK